MPKNNSLKMRSGVAGIGYKLTDNIELELNFGHDKHKFTSPDLSVGEHSYKSQREYSYETYSWGEFANNEHRNRCYPDFIYTKEDICEEGWDNKEFNYTSLDKFTDSSATVHVNHMLAKFKYVVFNKFYFSPYIIMGAGLVHHNIKKRIYSYEKDTNQMTVKRIKKNSFSLGYSIGAGTKIRLYKNAEIELSAEYYDHGKVALKQSRARRIRGYDVSAGIVVALE